MLFFNRRFKRNLFFSLDWSILRLFPFRRNSFQSHNVYIVRLRVYYKLNMYSFTRVKKKKRRKWIEKKRIQVFQKRLKIKNIQILFV